MSHPYLYVHRCDMCNCKQSESGERWRDEDRELCNECLDVVEEERRQEIEANQERKELERTKP